ncbi:MAG TPA: ATP-binding cassette domain-containing protein, partial [Candidatus Binataceae bacterium]|nr:ATP-binding cassette domain-containing protein [Candidatus Binataceae bacterium]
NYALYPHMTVAENIGFALKLRHLPKDQLKAKVNEAAEVLGLTDWLDRKPGQLSGGQRQRVAMGRAIVREPSVFLMDEPLSNLDAKLRVQMRAEVARIQRRIGVATIYVTHDQVEAMTMGDRVAVLTPVGSETDCNLQQIDTPKALYERPANIFVAGFIGSPAMNFLRVRLVLQPDQQLAVDVSGADIRFGIPPKVLIARPGLRDRIGQEIVLGIRPESFTVAASEVAVFHADVLVIEAHGADSFVFFDLPTPPVNAEERLVTSADGQAATRTRLTARIPSSLALRAGERLPLSPDPLQLHWFDPQTAKAIGTD